MKTFGIFSIYKGEERIRDTCPCNTRIVHDTMVYELLS